MARRQDRRAARDHREVRWPPARPGRVSLDAVGSASSFQDRRGPKLPAIAFILVLGLGASLLAASLAPATAESRPRATLHIGGDSSRGRLHVASWVERTRTPRECVHADLLGRPGYPPPTTVTAPSNRIRIELRFERRPRVIVLARSRPEDGAQLFRATIRRRSGRHRWSAIVRIPVAEEKFLTMEATARDGDGCGGMEFLRERHRLVPG